MKGNDTRKGFKFTKKASVLAENVAFEDLREDVSSPAAKKRRSAITTDNDTQSVDYSRKVGAHVHLETKTIPHSPTKVNTSMSPPQRASSSPARKSSRISRSPPQRDIEQRDSMVEMLAVEALEGSSNVRTELSESNIEKAHISKAYYPKINYDPSQSGMIATALSGSLSHKDILVSLVTDICRIESLGLKSYSDENKGRDSIILALQDILLMLPDEISAATPEAIVFQPELNTDERVEVENLEGIVAALKQQSSTLERYENDISEVGQKYNIWTDGIPQSDTINAVASSSTLQGINILEIAEQYDNILSDLKSHCGVLLSLTETLDTVKTEARLAQSALYDTAQAIRVKVNSSKGESSDPKDLIRNYLAL